MRYPASPAWMVLITLVACGGARRPWREASAQHTISAYEAFANAWPDRPEAQEARVRIEALRWEAAASADDVPAYEAYLAEHADGPHADDARAALDRLAWARVVAASGTGPVAAYLADWPTGAHAAEAAALLEQRAWDATRADGSREALTAFLDAYGTGPHASDARAALHEVDWAEIAAADTIDGYAWYLSRHADGPHADEARARADALRFSEVTVLITLLDARQPVEPLVDAVSRALVGALNDAGFAATVEVSEAAAHPFDVVPGQAGRGLLAVVIRETWDPTLETLAYATRLDVELALYAGARRDPVARIPLVVHNEARLEDDRRGAIDALAVELFGLPLPLSAHRREGGG